MFLIAATVLLFAAPAEAQPWRVVGPNAQWEVHPGAAGTRFVDAEGDDELIVGRARVARGGWTLSRERVGEVTERWLDHGGSVEQRWELPQRPPGEGALVVTVPVEGAVRIREDAAGIHLRARGGGNLLYGHGVFVDARGFRWDVPARFEDGAIRLAVSEDVLERAAYPAVLDPIISGDKELLPASLGASTGRGVSVAWDGTTYLATWKGRYGANRIGRISKDAAPLEPSRFLGSGTYRPGIASDGAGHLAAENSEGAWLNPADESKRPPSIPFGTRLAGTAVDVSWTGHHYTLTWANRVARLSAAGERLDPLEGAVIPGEGSASYGARSRSATAQGVTLVVLDAKGPLRAYRRTVEGTWLDESPIVVAPEELYDAFDVSTDGDAFLVTWAVEGRVSAMRVGRNGALLDPVARELATDAVAEAVTCAFDGSDYLVAYVSGADTLRMVRVPTDGSSTTDAGAEVPLVAVKTVKRLELTHAGQHAMLVADVHLLDDSERSVAIPLDASGAVAGPWRVISTVFANQTGLKLSRRGAGGLWAVWEEHANYGQQLVAARLDESLELLDVKPIPLTGLNGVRRLRATGQVGSSLIAVWDEEADGSVQRFVRAVDADGVLLGEASGTLGPVEDPGAPVALACEETGCLLVWLGDDLRAARIDPVGVVFDPDGLQLPIDVAGLQQGSGEIVVGEVDGAYVVVAADGLRNTLASLTVEASGAVTGPRDEGPRLRNLQMACRTGTCTLVGNGMGTTEVHSVLFTRVDDGWRSSRPPMKLTGEVLQFASDGQSELLRLRSWGGAPRLVRLMRGLPASTHDVEVPSPAAQNELLAPLEVGRHLVAFATRGPDCMTQGCSSTERLTFAGSTVSFDEPLLDPGPYEVASGRPSPLPLVGLDPQEDPVTVTVLTQPVHGELQGTWPQLTYVPRAAGYSGPDSFTAEASDGTHGSGEVTVHLQILPPEEPPAPDADAGVPPTEEPPPATEGCACATNAGPMGSTSLLIFASALVFVLGRVRRPARCRAPSSSRSRS